MTLVHWDDVAGFDVPESVRPLGGRWQGLTYVAYGTKGRVEPLGYLDGEPS